MGSHFKGLLILKTGHLFLSTNQTFQTNHTDRLYASNIEGRSYLIAVGDHILYYINADIFVISAHSIDLSHS